MGPRFDEPTEFLTAKMKRLEEEYALFSCFARVRLRPRRKLIRAELVADKFRLLLGTISRRCMFVFDGAQSPKLHVLFGCQIVITESNFLLF